MQRWWFDDHLGLKNVYLQCLYDLPLCLKDFININEYVN